MSNELVSPCEGDIILLNDLSLWIVKGCFHPRGYIVALPRIINGRKIKKLRDMYEVIKRYYAHFLKFVPELGLKVPLIPMKFVKKLYSSLSTKCIKGIDRLQDICTELLEIIESNCSIECGITGSLLGKYYTSSSDIDLVCLDKPKLYDCLMKLRKEGILLPLTERTFSSELIEVSEGLDRGVHIKLITSKVLQGSFKSHRYTLRVINCLRLRDYLGPYDVVMRVPTAILKIRASDYRTPAIIMTDIIKVPLGEYSASKADRSLCISHRLRYTELPKGSIIIIHDALLMIKKDIPIFNLDFSNNITMIFP